MGLFKVTDESSDNSVFPCPKPSAASHTHGRLVCTDLPGSPLTLRSESYWPFPSCHSAFDRGEMIIQKSNN